MYTHIMVPLDLAEAESLKPAIGVAIDLADHYKARLTLISVSGGISARVSHSSDEYGRRLAAFAATLPAPEGVVIETHNIHVPDPSVEVDRALLNVIAPMGVDLAVIGSHTPGWTDWIVTSHGGRLAAHAPISVMVVRDTQPNG